MSSAWKLDPTVYCLSVCVSRSDIVSKRLNVWPIFDSGSLTILVFMWPSNWGHITCCTASVCPSSSDFLEIAIETDNFVKT